MYGCPQFLEHFLHILIVPFDVSSTFLMGKIKHFLFRYPKGFVNYLLFPLILLGIYDSP